MRRKGYRSWSERLTEKRAEHPKAYERWSDEDVELLKRLTHTKLSIEEIAQRLGRQPSAVECRLAKMLPRRW